MVGGRAEAGAAAAAAAAARAAALPAAAAGTPDLAAVVVAPPRCPVAKILLQTTIVGHHRVAVSESSVSMVPVTCSGVHSI
jgi:hypothetical protein